MRKISSVIMACAMCLSMTVVGTVAPKVAVQAEETAAVALKEAPTTVVPEVSYDSYNSVYTFQYSYLQEDWISAITSVEVNGVKYEKAAYSFALNESTYLASKSSYNIKIGKKEFKEGLNKVVIDAEGYKNLILEAKIEGKNTTVAIHTTHTGGTATCLKKAVCDFCGEGYGDLADHTYGDTYKTDGKYHWKECEVCGQETEKEAHKGGTATTTKKAVCDVCGAEYGSLKQKQPTPVATTTVKNNTKPAAKPAKKTVKAKKVVVNKKSIVLKKGKKAKIKVKLVPAKATEKVTFKTSNKKVAKVTKSGVVKAVKKGKCKITVKTASGKKAVVKVTVK